MKKIDTELKDMKREKIIKRDETLGVRQTLSCPVPVVLLLLLRKPRAAQMQCNAVEFRLHGVQVVVWWDIQIESNR